jgi:hypothetical protein
LCSIAARLNPNYELEEAFDADALSAINNQLIEAAKAEAPVTTPPNEDRTVRLFAFMKRATDSQQTLESRLREQLDRYAREGRERRRLSPGAEIDVMQYGIAKRQCWPELVAYALHVMTTPISSSATERLFSIAVEIEEIKRLRLTPKHREDIAMVNRNLAFAKDVIMKS